jgi:hypothetical protein
MLSDIAVDGSCEFQGTPASMAMRIANLLHVREVPLPNLGPKAGYTDGLPQYLQLEARMVHRLSEDNFFPNSYFTNNSTT